MKEWRTPGVAESRSGVTARVTRNPFFVRPEALAD